MSDFDRDLADRAATRRQVNEHLRRFGVVDGGAARQDGEPQRPHFAPVPDRTRQDDGASGTPLRRDVGVLRPVRPASTGGPDEAA